MFLWAAQRNTILTKKENFLRVESLHLKTHRRKNVVQIFFKKCHFYAFIRSALKQVKNNIPSKFSFKAIYINTPDSVTR